MEHHSNFVPWQQLGKERGVRVDIWGMTDDGELDLSDLERLVTKKTRLLAVTAASNVLGTINPIAKIVRTVKRLNSSCLVLVDAAQAAPHMPVDVTSWGADLVAFSSHKMLGPTGIGVLWGKRAVLEKLHPFNYGGEMISEVHVDRTTFKPIPHRFEAGTPHIAGVIGVGAAIEYLSSLGMDAVRAHEEKLVTYAIKQFARMKGVRFLGPKQADKRGGVFALQIDGVHPHDVAQLLNEENVFVRAGNHCAMPLHEAMGVNATARASFYVYTTTKDIDALVISLEKVQKMFL
jgi:cysteine desulfurase/selenocysteine lyase